MVNCLVVFSISIYQPDTIEAVHLAVVADPKSTASLIRPRTALRRTEMTEQGGNGTGKEYFFFGFSVNGSFDLGFFFMTGHPVSSRLAGLSIFHQREQAGSALVNEVTAEVGLGACNLIGFPCGH